MFRLSDVRIGTKLAISSAIAILLVAGSLAMQLLNNRAINETSDRSGAQQTLSLNAAETKASMRGLVSSVREFRLAANGEELKAADDLFNLRFASFEKFSNLVVGTARSENLERMTRLKALANDYRSMKGDISQLKVQLFAVQSKAPDGVPVGADAVQYASYVAAIKKAIVERDIPIYGEMNKLADQIIDAAMKMGAQFDKDAAQVMASSELTGTILSVLTILMLIGTAVFATVGIARPLNALVAPLEEVAGGNFAITVPGVGRKDEVGQIADAVQLMAQKVSSTIGNIRNSGREVTNASAEISTSTTDLSQRTEEQAASLEQTSAAMEELSSTVKKNAENAQMANTDANNTRTVADRGGKVVAQAVEAMAKIEDSSRKISDIIGVIDEIARQTNLLALNAAVEAARAGEAGRGFAVVASEVRSLAQRSSQAAKDIKDLITNSNGQVKDGVALVNRAGESLSEIVESIKKVAAGVSDIANASIEQATGIEQINRALTQMDEVTQQNSALVEENAATAKTLEHQAKAMDEQVAFFQIGNGDARREPSHGREQAATPAPRRAVPTPSRGSAASKPRLVTAPKRVASGGARGVQTALATAVNLDSDWKEF